MIVGEHERRELRARAERAKRNRPWLLDNDYVQACNPYVILDLLDEAESNRVATLAALNDAEPAAIVRDLAAQDAPVHDLSTGWGCRLCDAEEYDHDAECPWRRACEWVERHRTG